MTSTTGITHRFREVQADHDELAAKRTEHELVELGGRLAEASGTVSYLQGALDEAPCDELLERIDAGIAEVQGHLSRLMCEAKKAVRGE